MKYLVGLLILVVIAIATLRRTMPPPHGTAAEAAAYSGGNSGRDTGSDYGQFDRAVSQAANNPAPSSGGDGVNWSPSDDIDSTYTTTSFDVTPEESSAGEFMNNITSAYEKVEVPLKYANMIMSPDPFSFRFEYVVLYGCKKETRSCTTGLHRFFTNW
jgi:hypothetical protein